MRRSTIMTLLTGALVLSLTGAFATVTFDATTGTGFVGKGDVQLVYGWNNAQLQANAANVQFRANSVTETSWECYREANDKTQERTRTSTVQGVVSSIGRLKSQITGFNLLGYDGEPTSTTEGPQLYSCPANPSGWVFVEGSESTTTSGGGLEVSIDGVNWYAI